MKTLKKMIRQSLYLITGISVVVLLILLLCVNLIMGTVREYNEAIKNIHHIKSLLAENQKELEEIKEEYRVSCIHNAETVARIIESDPKVIRDVAELKEIAASVEVSEIHIFDRSGRIFSGTHPEYYGYTFDSGKQMSFFEPMLHSALPGGRKCVLQRPFCGANGRLFLTNQFPSYLGLILIV